MVKKPKSYCIPLYCRMSGIDHLDGMGGCWGISYGLVAQQGRDYCRLCAFYRRNAERVDPVLALSAQTQDRNRGKFMYGGEGS
jgi:hypothetical protein